MDDTHFSSSELNNIKHNYVFAIHLKPHLIFIYTQDYIILYKKGIGNKVKPIKSLNRRICGIIINFTPSLR